MLNEYFDKIFCINLDKRPENWEYCQSEFKKHNLEVERFSAVDGRNTDVKPNNHKLVQYPGHLGCVLSHLNLAKKIKEEGYDRVLILEDDVKFINDLNDRFTKLKDQIPEDWDMLYLSGNNSNPESTMTRVTDNIYKITHTLTTHSYAIKNSTCDIIIAELEKVDRPVDIAMTNIQKVVNAYITRPHLSWQKEGYSDILNRVTNNEQYTRY